MFTMRSLRRAVLHPSLVLSKASADNATEEEDAPSSSQVSGVDAMINEFSAKDEIAEPNATYKQEVIKSLSEKEDVECQAWPSKADFG